MKIGEKIPTRKLIDILDSSGVKSQNPDRGFQDLTTNLYSCGWELNHVAYKPKLKFWNKGEPGFLFVLQDPTNKQITENMEIPYGPQVKDFVLENCNDIYYIRNISFWERKGFSRERLLVE